MPILFLLLSILIQPNITTHAQALPGQELFVQFRNNALGYTALIGSYIVTGLGAIALIVNVVQIIWSLMSGNPHQISQKIMYILLSIFAVAVGIWIGGNASSLFPQ